MVRSCAGRGSRPAFLFLPIGLLFVRGDLKRCAALQSVAGAVHGSPILTCEILDCQGAVAGDLAGQVATKRFNGSRLSPCMSGLLRFDNQGDRRPSDGCGDGEAGGRASAAAGRVRARLSLDAVFPVPKGSSRKIYVPTVFWPSFTIGEDDALRRRGLGA